MKKIVTMIVSVLLVLGMALGLVACDGKPRGSTDFTEEGETKNAQTAKDYVASREDTRTAAFSAFKADGTKIADYKAMANAINATVDGGIDAYVTKIGGGHKLFVNREGYVKDKNDDVYWTYENGTSLDNFACYDSVDTVKSLMRANTTVIKGSEYGKRVSQSWNGYQLLNKIGEDYSNVEQPPKEYELSSALDANVLVFPKRFSGMTKSSYKIEMNKMEVVPGFTTGDESYPVYAFMGFYMWQDYYVINIGIACDTKTGNWYPYIGTSRDDSATDTVYMEEGCVMTSTWDETKGAFIPDAESVVLTVETKRFDDNGEKYQVNDFTAEVSNGSKYTRRITSSLVGQYFSKKPLSIENTYVFVAGLDVISEVNASSVRTKAVDYFNGAQLKNLTVSEASAYIPTEEELSQADYGKEIKFERGKNHNLVMAQGGSDIIDYTILNNGTFCEYKKDGTNDVYSFNFDKASTLKPESANDLSAKSKVNQDRIDVLSSVTEENAMERKGEIFGVTAMYGQDANGTGSSLAIKYRNVLDFTQYLKAWETLKKAAKLSEDAAKFVSAFNGVAPLSSYVMKGWKAPADAASTNQYLYNDYQAAKVALEIYPKLDAENKENVIIFVQQAVINDWKAFIDEMDVLTQKEAFKDTKIIATTLNALADKPSEVKLTAENAFAQTVYWALQIKNGGTWEGAAKKVMDADNSWFPSTFIVSCYKAYISTGLETPTFVKDLLEEVDYDNFLDAFDSIYYTAKIAMEIKTGNLTTVASLSEEAKTKLNIYWVSGYTINGNLSWNWNSGNKFEMFMGLRSIRPVILAGGNLKNGEANFKTFEYFKVVEDFLKGAGYTVKDNGWGVTAATIA